jgi:hypothetical protein
MVKFILTISILSIFVGVVRGANKPSEVDLFIKNHPHGLAIAGTAEGSKSWKSLIKLYTVSGDERLLGLALKSPSGVSNQAAEKSMHLVEILKKRPDDFIRDSKKFVKKNSCIFRYIIPRTQFIHFDEIKGILSRAKKNRDVDVFSQEARLYYEAVKAGKPLDPSLACPDKL